ncbi:MAG: NUDIX hydrolase [Ruminococcaceae bacterium]|nr:NUDIX hydrolase [Oscillospiraceae bacterium]
MNNKFYTVCGIVEIDDKVLLVRHTYGTAKDRILLPGGFVQENELPTMAVEREVFEETGVTAKAQSVVATQFKQNQWCVVFEMSYVSGVPKSDNYENSEVLLLSATEAIKRNDITNMSREVLTAYISNKPKLQKSDYIPASSNENEYVIFGI